MMKPLVIKVGGALLEAEHEKVLLLQTIAKLIHQSVQVVLVHGGGCLVDEWLASMGHKVDKVNGLRVTPLSQINVVTGALAGAANKSLVAAAKSSQIAAVGISLCDGDLIAAEYVSQDLGQVGHCVADNPTLLNSLLVNGYTPIISSIGDDNAGQLLNINADQAAQAIAQLIDGKLILLSDVPGVLNADKSLIHELTWPVAKRLIAQNVIAGGMKVKVEAAFNTALALNDSIIIASWRHPQDLLAFAAGNACGTTIQPH